MSEQYRCENEDCGNELIVCDLCKAAKCIPIPASPDHIATPGKMVPQPANSVNPAPSLSRPQEDVNHVAPQPMPWEKTTVDQLLNAIEGYSNNGYNRAVAKTLIEGDRRDIARALFEAMEKDGTLELAHWWSEKDGHKIISCELNCPVCKWKKLLKEGR